eukprot:2342958-Alexandrium_andersonii.AAC.1
MRASPASRMTPTAGSLPEATSCGPSRTPGTPSSSAPAHRVHGSLPVVFTSLQRALGNGVGYASRTPSSGS